MATSLHKHLHNVEVPVLLGGRDGEKDVHAPHAFTYADAAARNSAVGMVATDIGKLARQEDDGSLWILTNHSPLSWSQIFSGSGDVRPRSETLTYTDTVNKVIGPTSYTPVTLTGLNWFVFTGMVKEYTVDYTVRQVIGGSAPGYYICISPTSAAPGGGTFVGGSNPGSGIESVLAVSDKVRVSYPAE